MKKRILITGASGFIGQNISKAIEDAILCKHNEVDLRNWDQTFNYIQYYKPTHIIHCAARHGGYLDMSTDKVGYYRDNMLIDINVLEAARLSNVKRVVTLSSTTAFPADINEKMSEKVLFSGSPHGSCYTYGFAKRMLTVLTKAYREQYDLDYKCLVLSNVYGPGNLKTVIPAILKTCYLSKLNNRPLKIYGDGSNVRDFVFIDDVINIILWALDNYNECEPLIISTGVETTIRELVNIIVDVVDFSNEIIWDDSETTGQLFKVADNKKLMSLMDFNFMSLKDGVNETFLWMKSVWGNLL